MDAVYRSDVNRDVAPAAPGEVRALQIGPIRVWPPVVLAPMAGVTNYPFRSLCREFGAGLYVSEMITARPLVEGNARPCGWRPSAPRRRRAACSSTASIPTTSARRCKRLVGEGRVDHIDLNFGCPVRKVTRNGGGAAIRSSRGCSRTSCARRCAAPGRCRSRSSSGIGTDDAPLHVLEPGRVGQEEGCAAVALHARTAAQLYDGVARWDAIGRAQAARAAHPRARQRRHLGGRGRAAHDARDRMRRRRRRPRMPGPAVVVSRSGRRVRGPRAAESAASRRDRRDHAAPRAQARRVDRRSAGDARLPPARELVHQGLPRQRDASASG